MEYAAFVPFKGKDWHTRLNEILTYDQRRELALHELLHTLSIWGQYTDLYTGLQSYGELNSRQLRMKLILLVLVYNNVRMLPKLSSLRIFPINDVNDGIQQFSDLALQRGYKGIIISGSDLPLLTSKDAEDLLSLANSAERVVVFSSARDGGTPVYMIRPPGMYIPRLYVDDGYTNTGRQENDLHTLGIQYIKIIDMDGLCRDLDTPEDLLYILTNGRDSPPVVYLRSLSSIIPLNV
jgi:2-phospho-L-lactate guanylyltransferase (CobY/MobA/RfbA family)